jgi:hypothetical protein
MMMNLRAWFLASTLLAPVFQAETIHAAAQDTDDRNQSP